MAFSSLFPLFLTRPRPDLGAAAAAGLAAGVFLASAPLLAGPVGMPGEAVRYLLLTGMLLAAVVGTVLRRRGRGRPGRATAAARRALAACVLAGAAPPAAALLASPLVFAALLAMAAALGGGSLRLYRPRHSWHAACLAGAGAAGAAVVLLAQHPQVACALACALAALLLTPACVRAAPDDSGRAAASHWTAGAVGAAVFGVVFAGQSLVVFRWELLGGAGARPFAYAALLAAALTSGVAVAGRRRPITGAGTGTGTGLRGALFTAAGLTAAVAACASAARPWQLVLALAAVLTSGAATSAARAGSSPARDNVHAGAAGHAGYAVAALFGGATAMTAVALSGRLLGGADTLTVIGLAPAMAAAGAMAHRGRGQDAEPDDDNGAGACDGPLTVRGLGVRQAGAPPVRRLDLTLAPGEIACLTDALPGRRAGAVLAVLAGLRKADGGTWRLRGHDVSRVEARARWDLRLSAFVDPADAARTGALHPGHPAVSVTDAVAAAAAHLDPERAAELTVAARAAFPFLAAKGADPCGRLGPDERCVLGLVQTLIAQPALLLLDLTGPGCGPLAADPAVTSVLRHIAGQGTAVLVASAPAQAVPGQRPIALPASGGSRTALLRRNRKAMP
ncbi:hypothetical protein [Streptomyces sp. G-G2]|uniref:hypothetical protein n=1 Tax=Streptomyces sp. G-G2 TaxID=3046201 RepID=UPI0024BB634B|nr:hypothetical protein [Streptomyces sp. G-G2]MDJ0382173.1 hypothetical protein [Streptomyces sp. G-G2]